MKLGGAVRHPAPRNLRQQRTKELCTPEQAGGRQGIGRHPDPAHPRRQKIWQASRRQQAAETAGRQVRQQVNGQAEQKPAYASGRQAGNSDRRQTQRNLAETVERERPSERQNGGIPPPRPPADPGETQVAGTENVTRQKSGRHPATAGRQAV